MEGSSQQLAKEYYTLVGSKDSDGIKKYLHPEVKFISPLAILNGIYEVLSATRNFMEAFKTLTIRASFGGEGEAMVVYDVNIPGVSEKFPGASFLHITEGKITRIELFYDGGKMREKREKIFQ